MKKRISAPKSSLFLIELILSILILSLSAAIYIPVFASSWKTRKTAREYKQIQELSTNVSEILKATDGRTEDYLAYLPSGVIDNEKLLYYYDSMWVPTDASHASYIFSLTPDLTTWKKALKIEVLAPDSAESLLYQLEVAYPAFSVSQEVTDESF